MKLTIIETGLPPEAIRADWPTYPAMFETLISQVDDGFSYETISIVTGDNFPELSQLDGVIHTGSAYGVYDEVDWMPGLMDFIRKAAKAQIPQFGVCFGHQAMAEALGGKVVKSDKGWGVGRHTYETPHRPDWAASGPMTPLPASKTRSTACMLLNGWRAFSEPIRPVETQLLRSAHARSNLGR